MHKLKRFSFHCIISCFLSSYHIIFPFIIYVYVYIFIEFISSIVTFVLAIIRWIHLCITTVPDGGDISDNITRPPSLGLSSSYLILLYTYTSSVTTNFHPSKTSSYSPLNKNMHIRNFFLKTKHAPYLS